VGSFKDFENFLMDKYVDWEGHLQFEGTGERIKRLIDEMCWSSEKIGEELKKCLKQKFEADYDEMLVTGPISTWTLCPHHMLPVQFECWIGYIPSGRVLGLSKFTRIADIMSRRPILQEQYTTELSSFLMEKLEPKGVGVYVRGVHGCMASRGVRQGSPVVTSSLKGCFMDEQATRSEFYSIVMKG
jgi:GTP cyclohydrolase I